MGTLEAQSKLGHSCVMKHGLPENGAAVRKKSRHFQNLHILKIQVVSLDSRAGLTLLEGTIHPCGSRPGHGRRHTLMAYGIGLVFDPHTEAHIKEVWGRLTSHGFTMSVARPGCLPHVSLILSETLRV